MPSQTTNSKAKTLGPFLTLILSSTKGDKATRTALQPESVGSSTSHYCPCATSDETLHATESAFRTPLILGPFLTLILTTRRHRSKGLMALAVRL
jgi:hypothetical protein